MKKCILILASVIILNLLTSSVCWAVEDQQVAPNLYNQIGYMIQRLANQGKLAESDAFIEFLYNYFNIKYTQEIKINISFAGDCTLGTDPAFGYTNSFPNRLAIQRNDYSYFFKNVKPIFECDDLTLVNLETTFTNASIPANKKFRFKGDPSYVHILKAGSIEMVNISNNHIYDYLQQGFKDTIKTLEDANILYSGEGYIAYYSIKGITIASIGYTGWDTSIEKKLYEDIKKAREKADIVIVSFHWGDEGSNYPNAIQKELGRRCIDNGADIVMGHHPHVIQGIENYKGKFIVYSMGNFCFGGNSNPWEKDSFIFQAQFTLKDKSVVSCEDKVIPCRVSSVSYVNNYQPVELSGEECERVLQRIYNYSSVLEYGIKVSESMRK